MFDVRKSAWAWGLLLGLVSVSSHAQSNLSGSNDPSLMLLIWDPVNKVSYSRDTGLNGTTLFNGLSDTGSQQFWTIDPATDASFAKFSQASTDLSKDIWMVVGGGKAESGSTAGTNVVFSTMVNTVADGVVNPQWPSLTGITNLALRSTTIEYTNHLYSPLTDGNGTPYNNYATAPAGTGSSFDTAATNGYLGSMQPVFGDRESGTLPGQAFFGGHGGGTGEGFDTGNLLGDSGSSSWFYYLTPSSTDPRKPLNTEAITVSAFSNSAELAYWGLARTDNTSTDQGKLVLSFTMPSAITQTVTAAGLMRRNQTDYTAQYGSVLWIAAPGQQQFAGWTPSPLLTLPDNAVTAVPEPQSVLLMALGLGGVFAAAARRKRRTPATDRA